MQAYFPFAPSFSGAGRRRKENEGLALRVHGKDVKFSIRQGMMIRRKKKEFIGPTYPWEKGNDR